MHPGHGAEKTLFHSQPLSNDKIRAHPEVVSKIVIHILLSDLTANTQINTQLYTKIVRVILSNTASDFFNGKIILSNAVNTAVKT